MRNLYNGRTERPVGRYIEFNNYKEIARFVNLYKDLFYRPVKGDINHEYGFHVTNYGELRLCFTIFKEDWKVIENNINLECQDKGRGKRFWKYIG